MDSGAHRHGGVLVISLLFSLVLMAPIQQEKYPESLFLVSDEELSCTAKFYEGETQVRDSKLLTRDIPPKLLEYSFMYEQEGKERYYHILDDLNLTSHDFEIRVVCYEPRFRGVASALINASNIGEYASGKFMSTQ